MSRYEIKYNEKLLKHYFYDNELKEQISFDDVLKVIEEQNNQLAELQEKYDACQEARKLENEFKNQEFDEHIQELIKMEKKLTKKDKEIEELKEILKQALGFLEYKENQESAFEVWIKWYKGE